MRPLSRKLFYRTPVLPIRLSPLLTFALVVSGCGPPAPDRNQMETLTGAALDKPLRFGGPFDSWVNYFRTPIPNQMAVRTTDDGPKQYVWLYTFRADSSYRPPASGLLGCEVAQLGEYEPTVALRCSAEERDERGAWAYAVEFYPEYGGGSLSAVLTEE